MLGAGLQFNRSCRNPSQSLSSRQNHQNQDHIGGGAKSDLAISRSAKSDVRASADEPLKEKPVIVADQVREASSVSNIQRFMQSITPSIMTQHLPKSTMRSWKIDDGESQPYFVLGDSVLCALLIWYPNIC